MKFKHNNNAPRSLSSVEVSDRVASAVDTHPVIWPPELLDGKPEALGKGRLATDPTLIALAWMSLVLSLFSGCLITALITPHGPGLSPEHFTWFRPFAVAINQILWCSDALNSIITPVPGAIAYILACAGAWATRDHALGKVVFTICLLTAVGNIVGKVVLP